jgi:hypothetical protein
VLFHRHSNTLEEGKQRDETKTTLCKEKGTTNFTPKTFPSPPKNFLIPPLGITLIQVPYWWDRKSSSLEATIYRTRPDLFASKPTGTPIPNSIPETRKTTTTSIKNFL